jgi:MazG family protein
MKPGHEEDPSVSDSLQRLLGIMRALRDPQSGCAWDREQTFESIVPHTLEEAHELAEAIAAGDPLRIRDELGDLLFQVVFLARIAEERGLFAFDDVARGISDKLVRRHPHVFAAPAELSAAEQTQAWETFKENERRSVGEQGTLDGVARALPALTRAVKLGKRAARVRFDWPDASGMRAKLDEELGEFETTLANEEGSARQHDELGDLLFVIANWARHLKLDPEAALRGTNAKFERRFAHMEQTATAAGTPLQSLDAEAWERLWQGAKAAERAPR